MAGPLRITIDELSERTGVTVRNIRSYQTKGLLPPPALEKHGGPYVGYYDSGHVERLALIGRLKKRGFSLDSINHLLAASDQGAGFDELLGIEADLTSPAANEAPRTFTTVELRNLFPELVKDRALEARLVELGLLTKVRGGFEAREPGLVRIAHQLNQAGLPLPALLDAFETMRRHALAATREVASTIRPLLLDPLLTATLAGAGNEAQLATLHSLPALGADAMRLVFLDALRDVLAATAP